MLGANANQGKNYLYLGIFAAAILIISAVLLRQYIFPAKEVEKASSQALSRNGAEEYGKRLNDDFLTDKRFLNLRDTSARPKTLSEIDLGKSNPFE